MKTKSIPWLFLGLWFLVFVLMVCLGFWQLSRAEEKTLLLKNINQSEPVIVETPEQWHSVTDFMPVEVTGQWLPGIVFYLANQFSEGQLGYHVYQPMILPQQQLVLVNRGWVKAPQDATPASQQGEWRMIRSPWPVPAVQLGEQELTDETQQTVTYLPEKITEAWLFQRFCGQDKIKNCIIQPFVLKLDASMPDGFQRQWQNNIMPPEKHRAYAVQWFTMATVLLLICIAFLRKSHASKN